MNFSEAFKEIFTSKTLSKNCKEVIAYINKEDKFFTDNVVAKLEAFAETLYFVAHNTRTKTKFTISYDKTRIILETNDVVEANIAFIEESLKILKAVYQEQQ